jgi:threonine/homoserine/homoserine lactone efflux protein
MNLLLLILFAYFLGFITAIPIGATQVEIAKRSLKGYVVSALMIALASSLSDVMYGTIAFFGIAPFLKNEMVISAFLAVGIVVLIALSFFTFRKSQKDTYTKSDDKFLINKKMSFIVGFSLAATNPPVIFWWLAEVQFAKDFGIYTHFNTTAYIFFLLFGGLGLFSYLSFLSVLLHKVKHFVSEKMEKRINIVLSIILVFIAIYFLVRLINVLHGKSIV